MAEPDRKEPLPYADRRPGPSWRQCAWGALSLLTFVCTLPGMLRCLDFFDLAEYVRSGGFRLAASGTAIGVATSITGLTRDRNRICAWIGLAVNCPFLMAAMALLMVAPTS